MKPSPSEINQLAHWAVSLTNHLNQSTYPNLLEAGHYADALVKGIEQMLKDWEPPKKNR